MADIEYVASLFCGVSDRYAVRLLTPTGLSKELLKRVNPEEKGRIREFVRKHPFSIGEKTIRMKVPRLRVALPRGEIRSFLYIDGYCILHTEFPHFLESLYAVLSKKKNVFIFGDVSKIREVIPALHVAYAGRKLAFCDEGRMREIRLSGSLENVSMTPYMKGSSRTHQLFIVEARAKTGEGVRNLRFLIALDSRGKWWRISCATCYKIEKGVYAIGSDVRAPCPHIKATETSLMSLVDTGKLSEPVGISAEQVEEGGEEDVIVYELNMDPSLILRRDTPRISVKIEGHLAIVETDFPYLGSGKVDLKGLFCLTDKSYNCPHVWIARQWIKTSNERV